MYLTVVTASKSSRIGGGLTYESDGVVAPGTAVRVPLRRSLVDGLVVDVREYREKSAYDIKSVHEILSPLLTEAQMKTVHWMSEYYCCSLRQALTPWLPVTTWAKLLPSSPLRATRYAGQAGPSVTPNAVSLTDSQQKIFDEITQESRPSLLMTGPSINRTEVYAALVAEAIKRGTQAIVLVPEILLTTELVDRFYALLPRERIAVMHSHLTPATRREEWKRIHQGNVDLVIGSRSALFAPVQKLGLVIIDDEHEWTYKSEQTPRYHTRETAEHLCRHAGAKLVAASSSPSLEAWAKAKTGTFHLVSWKSEHRPTIHVIDLAEVDFAGQYPFSPQLLTAIRLRLERKEQCLLLLNRKGSVTGILCMQCRTRMPAGPPMTACPRCGGVNLRSVGAGTEGAERVLKKLFPKAAIIRADKNKLKKSDDVRALMEVVHTGKADILLGTQMILKGMHFPKLTLAAALVSDVGLSQPDFRAGEEITQRLTALLDSLSVSPKSECVLQTFRPASPELRAVQAGALEQFLDDELTMRIKAGYPPAVPMIRLYLRGPEAQSRMRAIVSDLTAAALTSGSDAKTSSSVAPKPHITLRGADARRLLARVDLRQISVDVE